MTYDRSIRNGRIINGAGKPPFRSDVAVKDAQQAEPGKRGASNRVSDAQGMVVAPGFVENDCHYDAQVPTGATRIREPAQASI